MRRSGGAARRRGHDHPRGGGCGGGGARGGGGGRPLAGRGEGGAHLARPGGRRRESGERGVEQDAEDGWIVHPDIFIDGRGFIDDLLRGRVAQHQAGLAAVERGRAVHHPAGAHAPAPSATAAPAHPPAPAGVGGAIVGPGGGPGGAGAGADLQHQPGVGVVALQAHARERLLGQRLDGRELRGLRLLRGQAFQPVGGRGGQPRQGGVGGHGAVHRAGAGAAGQHGGGQQQPEAAEEPGQSGGGGVHGRSPGIRYEGEGFTGRSQGRGVSGNLHHLQARQGGRRGEFLRVEGPVAVFARNARGLQMLEVVQRSVQQVGRHDVLQGVEHVVHAAGEALVPVAQHLADLLALQVLLAAAEVAGNDRELLLLRPAGGVLLGHVGQRADHHVAAVVADQLRGHGLQLAAEEHVEQQRLEDVVAVVAQRDLGAAQLVGHAVEDAAAQAAAQAAGGLALRHHPLDDAVGVLVLDVEGHAGGGQVFGQDVLGEARLLLVEVHRHQVEIDGRAFLQLDEDVQQGVAVLAAGHAHHDLVALFDHAVIDDGAADLAAQALLELVRLAFDPGLRGAGGVGGPVGVLGQGGHGRGDNRGRGSRKGTARLRGASRFRAAQPCGGARSRGG